MKWGLIAFGLLLLIGAVFAFYRIEITIEETPVYVPEAGTAEQYHQEIGNPFAAVKQKYRIDQFIGDEVHNYFAMSSDGHFLSFEIKDGILIAAEIVDQDQMADHVFR